MTIFSSFSGYISTLLRGCGALLLSAALLTACAADNNKKTFGPDSDNFGASDQEIYDNATGLMDVGGYAIAARAFEELDRQYPYSPLAIHSQMMAAYAYYKAENKVAALAALDRFINLHPGNRNTPYAYYLRAIIHYDDISDVERDQSATRLAEEALREVVARYPDSEYARDARFKIALTQDMAAGKEMSVGRYYLERGDYLAAINRFGRVIRFYQTTVQVPEALYRMVEAYLSLGIEPEARANAAVLGHNFPDSPWYRRAYDLLGEGTK